MVVNMIYFSSIGHSIRFCDIFFLQFLGMSSVISLQILKTIKNESSSGADISLVVSSASEN